MLLDVDLEVGNLASPEMVGGATYCEMRELPISGCMVSVTDKNSNKWPKYMFTQVFSGTGETFNI